MTEPGLVPELCVVIVPRDHDAPQREMIARAMERRGFERFAERPLDGGAGPGLPEATRFGGGAALIFFNPLIEMSRSEQGAKPHFADPSIDAAAFHLGSVLADQADGLKIAATASQASRIAANLLTQAELDALQALIAERRRDMATDEPVLAVLSRHRYRAKVELVAWNGQTAVKKTFRRTGLTAMRNEIAFHDDVAPNSPVPARILERSDNALYFEHIPARPTGTRILGKSLHWPLPLPIVRQLADFSRLVAARGWDPVDLTPRDNVLIDDRTGALRCIDFEFARRREEPGPPETAAFLSGIPEGAVWADGFDEGMRQDPYPGKWRPFTGLSRRSLLNDPYWLQATKRVVVHPFWFLQRGLGAGSRRNAYLQKRSRILNKLTLEEPGGR